MVVLGNPPYSVSSSNKGEWITKLCEDYKKDLNERNIQPLSDDYIKFIRYGQHFVDKNKEGILAYISNNSFVDGIIHRQMRKSLLETFDKIYIIDLHGNSRKNEICPDGSKDENVFDIMQGVSINLFVKTNKKRKNQLAEVYHYDLYGKRDIKYEFLANNSLNSIPFNLVTYEKDNYFFTPKNFDNQNQYDKGFSIDTLFNVNTSGVKTHHDNELVSLTPFNTEFNNLYSYRPFDVRYINYDLTKVERARYSIMKHFIRKSNFGLISKRGLYPLNSAPIFISKIITDIRNWSCAGMLGSDFVFPLYIYEDIDNSRHPNFNNEIIQKFADGLKLKFTEEKTEEPETFAPIDVLDYIYAVLHSPKYRETYKEFLKIE